MASFKRRGVYLILGLLGAEFIRGSVYTMVVFISKNQVEENEIMCQFKTIIYFLNHPV